MNNVIQTEEKDLLRDLNSKALLNRDTKELAEYKRKKAQINNAKEKEKTFENRLNTLEKDMSQIKSMLMTIVSRIG